MLVALTSFEFLSLQFVGKNMNLSDFFGCSRVKVIAYFPAVAGCGAATARCLLEIPID
jgi:hypothetical protein